MGEIVNKIKESGLVSIDLADYSPKNKIEVIDLSSQLWQGLVLKEKDFRLWIKENDWKQYKPGTHVSEQQKETMSYEIET